MTKYNATAPSYDELYAVEQREKYRALESTLSRIRGKDLVLDAGCGTGLLIEYLESLGLTPGYYVGIDISWGMLMRARVRLSSLGVPGDLVQGDIEYMPLRDRCFHHALSITVLDNLYDASKALREIERVTRRGGVITVSRLKRGQRLPRSVLKSYRPLAVPDECKDHIYSREPAGHP